MHKDNNLRLVRSRHTKKLYRVIREYAHRLIVTDASRRNGPQFTLHRFEVEEV